MTTTDLLPPAPPAGTAGGAGAPAPDSKPKRRRLKRTLIAASAAVIIAGGGGTAWALDRFVVDHVEIADVRALEAAAEASYAASTAASTTSTTSSSTASSGTGASTATITSNSYVDGDTSMTIKKVVTGSGSSTVTYFVADVTLGTATELRSAFANNQFGENIIADTSEIAEDNNAIFAINGDYYGFRDTGIVIRNGLVYRDEGARVGLAFYRDGSVKVYDETTTTAAQLVADGVWNTLSFGPAIVEGGDIVSGIDSVEVDTNFGNHSIQGSQPRTAIGVIDTNHLVFVVVDGRSNGYSAGVTMTGLAQIMQDLGATTAYNIDGGGSSTMYFNGSLVNNPLGKGQERGTSDILYIGA
jgi:exopolysaccharide biosynthesis protein